MKKQFRFFTILMIIVFGTSSLAAISHFPVVNATYVQGAITQNTSWKLVDSPYVLFDDVLILPNVTLTIEPNVEVRFGGHFSLIVMGTLIANGTTDKMITFTSNKHIPAAGDWATIMFLGAQPSTLVNCVIEYGTNGTAVESGGNLGIQNSLVRFNSQNGIKIENGQLEAKNNEITNNTLNGIYVSGNDQVLIQNNTIKQNENGIALTGGMTSGIDIEENEILSNGQGGIVLEANAYINTVILSNTLSANHYGFYVLSDSSTFITHNYISKNAVGIYYQSGFGHQAHFNDIYDNGLGMDVPPQQMPEPLVVNATYNYWGDRTGPNHVSLNPYGRGNPVGGDGVDLTFIFFLTAPIDYNNARPTARLWSDKILAAPKQTVTLVGTDSYDDGRIDQYFFDFGDGKNSGWTTLSILDHNYSSTGSYDVRLKVMDDFGAQSYNALATISIQNLTPLQVSTALGQQTVYYNENLSITAHVTNATGAIENATVTLLPVGGGIATPQTGLTNSTGYFAATFKAPNVTEITNVRIIVRASKTGYADGSDYEYLKVLPPLTVQVLSEPETLKSEQTSVVTVHVTSGLEPIVNASVALTLAPNIGNLSTTTGITDINGNMTAIFTAPQTLDQTNVTIGALATKIGFAVGQNQKTIIVEPRTLMLQVSANPSVIVSEASSSITVHATSDGAPTSNALITIWSDTGDFSTRQGDTNANGDATFAFTAPQTTELVNATITAAATKSGYLSGQAQTVITIQPKALAAQVTATPMATVSESRVNITVYVSYGMSSVSDANVTISSNTGGNFNRTWTLTDSNGYANFAFTTPPANTAINVSLAVRASKDGYVDAENQLNITVGPATLNLIVDVSPTITSGETTVVGVHVVSNTTRIVRAIANASVTVTATDGSFQVNNATTDSNGYCEFSFTSPGTTTQISITITTNATKNGYISTGNQTTIIVNPIPPAETGGGGWSLLTMLLIIIPIAIAVVVIIVLIKRKIIRFSVEEDET